MSDIGIKISKRDVDVNKAEEKDLVYNSAYNSLKVHSSGNVTATGDPTDISHSLGYAPIFLAYCKDNSYHPNGYIMACQSTEASMNTERLRFAGTANGDKISYFIFYDPTQAIGTYRGVKTRDVGMKMSQEGKDVFKMTDTYTSFNSEFKTMQIREVFETTGAADGETTTVNHNYGYPAAFVAHWEYVSNGDTCYAPLPYNEPFTGATLLVESRDNDFVVCSDNFDTSDDVVNIFALTEALE